MLKNRRFALFVCTLSPLLVWPLSSHSLAHPWEVAAWFGVFAILAASTPARFLRLAALLQLFILPITLGWAGTVAVTGYGPSNAAFEAATSGAIHELWVAAQLAFGHRSFLVSAAVTTLMLIWALWATWGQPTPQAPGSQLPDGLFLLFLMPLIAVNMDGMGYPRIAQIAGQEARLSVAWLSHIGLAKSWVKESADKAGRLNGTNQAIRSAQSAERKFSMQPGLAVFIVGESLRADALMQIGRGPWSNALQARLVSGLGLRLRDACAGANSTFGSVPFLLTATEPGDATASNKSPTILASLKAAGAKTAYISNHEHWVAPETGHDLAQRTSSMEMVAYDDAVIEVLGDFVARSGNGPKAALLHIYGQHFLYDKRYPPASFPALSKNLSAAALEESHYARAAEYGVKVLLSAAAILDRQETPAFLVFTSDHGENLSSDGTGKKYHALPVSGKNDSTVPALVLWNQAFANTGRAKLLAPLAGSGSSGGSGGSGDLIAHRDVALAWLALAGMPGQLQATPSPRTWGAANEGAPPAAIACTTLKP